MSEAAPAAPTLPAEEAARANFYALLARLFYAPPDAALLASIAGESLDAEAGGVAAAWADLRRAAAAADPETLREEYETTFVGTGKAPVTLYTSAYTMRYASEAPLAALRGELAALGLARRSDVNEPEDHIAALCDTMRHLIATKNADLVEQKRFFERWIWPARQPLCDAIARSEHTVFYRSAASFLSSFCTIEHTAFEML